MRIAIVDGGIAGLTTARLRQDDYDVMLFERQLATTGKPWLSRSPPSSQGRA
jgi:protoporphyrinogen oxidase